MVEWWHLAVIAVSQIFAAGVVYGAIRQDIKHLHDTAAVNAQATARAHERIDNILERAHHAT